MEKKTILCEWGSRSVRLGRTPRMERLDEEDDCLLFLAYHVRKSVDP
jgi:hypothetical protein